MDELESVGRAIAALEAQRSTLGDAVVDLALVPLIERRNHLLDGTAGEQRKQVTVLFADLVEFTELSQALDAEDVRSVIGDYFGVWARCIEHEGGVVEKYIGDAVMAVFGIHRSHEDDPHRAVRAALAMVESLDALNADVEALHGVTLAMRVGIDTGDVVVGTLAEQAGRDLVVVGEIVNRAARLQAVAPPGAIALTADTCLHVRGSFALQSLGAVELKGIEVPVDAYLVLGAGPTAFWPEARGVEGVVTRTIGRHLELGWLQRVFEDAAGDGLEGGDPGGLVVASVIGHAGVGKSRLLRDFETWLATRPDHVRLFRGRASPSTEAVPNGLLRSMFAERLGISAGDPPRVVRERWDELAPDLAGRGADGQLEAHLLARLLGFEVGDSPYIEGIAADPQGLRTRALDHLADYLRRLGEKSPVVLLLEDAHWADDATLDWLLGLGDWLRDHRVLVVVTARSSLLERRPHWGEGLDVHAVLRLEPLSRRDSLQLVGEILQRADQVPHAVAELVAATSEGNPFYVEELVKWLVGEGVVDTSAERWTVSDAALDATRVPATLKGVIQARLDSLTPDERATAQRAAVVGRVFWDRAVAGLDPEGTTDTADALARLRAREIVFRREHSALPGTVEYSFRHALLRDVAYESVLRSTRRRYHGMAAGWLEAVADRTGRGDEYAAAVAEHHAEAGSAGDAARWYLRAGRGAAAVFANAEALALLRRAEQLATTEARELRLDIGLAIEGVLDLIGDREAQRSVLDALTADDDGADPLRTAAIRLAEANHAYFLGRYEEAAEVAAEAAALARGAGSGRVEAEAMLKQGRALAWSGAHDKALAVLLTAQQRAAAAGEPVLVGTALRYRTVVAVNRGDYAGTLDRLAEARDIHRDHHDAYQEAQDISQTAVVLEAMGRLDEATATYDEALAMAERSGHRYSQALLIGNLAGVALARGRLGEARRSAQRSQRMCEDIGDIEGQAEMHLLLGEVARSAGDLDEATALLDRAVALGQPIHADLIVVRSLTGAALVAVDAPYPDEARRLADDAVATARASEIPAAEARALLVDGLVRLAAAEPGAVPALQEARSTYAELGSGSGVLESDAALALAECRDGRIGEAAARATSLLPRLAPSHLEGCVDPGRALLACHDVLAAAGDEPGTDAVRRAITAYLDDRSASIDEADLRRGFLERAPVTIALKARSAHAG